MNVSGWSATLAMPVHPERDPRIEEDFSSGIQSGVNGTPAFYVNGQRHNGNWDFPALFAALTRAARMDHA